MRDRLIVPILIPVGAAGVIVLLIVSGSKILLNIDPAFATAGAIAAASSILLIAALLAVGPRLRPAQVYILTGVPVSIVLAIGLFLVVQPKPKAAGEGEVQATTSIAQVAMDNSFTVKAVTVPVNVEVTLTLENRGQAIHNWRLLGVQRPDGSDIKTELLPPGQTETIKFTVATAGTFEFQCDVHAAQMRGKLTAAEGVAVAGPQKAPTVNTVDNKFEPAALTVPANEEVTLTLNNRGKNPHNIRITAAGQEFKGNILQAGAPSETLQFTIAQPGVYDYICDVHPAEMKGKITVQ